jgi:hypothetical protein
MMNTFRKSISGRPGSNIPRPTGASVISTSSNVSVGGSGGGILHSNRNVQEIYHFPILKPQAIVSCMSDVQVPCTEEDLARPTPQKMLVVYEAFMDVAMGYAKDDCFLDDIQGMNIVSHPVSQEWILFFGEEVYYAIKWQHGELMSILYVAFCFFFLLGICGRQCQVLRLSPATVRKQFSDRTMSQINVKYIGRKALLINSGPNFHCLYSYRASMMHDVGVSDFTSKDMTKPEADRVRRVLSAVINFAKFREDRQPDFFTAMRDSDEVIDLIVQHEKEHEIMTQDLENMK